MRLSDLHRRVLAKPLEPLLLDAFPNAAAAYSLRKLRSAYTGNCIEVRRSSDNALQNIGFVNNVLDTVSLLSFVGAGNGFVRTWYDQSDNGLHLTKTTNNNQPQIVSSGSVIIDEGKPSILFDGVDDTLQNVNNIPLPSPVENNVFSVLKLTNEISTTNRTPYEFSNIQRTAFNIQNVTGFAFIGWEDSLLTSVSPSQNINHVTTKQLLNIIYLGGNASNKDNYLAFRNSISQTINQGGDLLSLISRSSGLSIGGRNNGLVNAAGYFQEFIIYSSNQSSNRIPIETNINDYYNIY
jgi:hypothetical protein